MSNICSAKKEGVSDLNNTIITVGSVTYAIKLRKLLSRAGIRSKLVKTERPGSKNGCTHGVEIDEKDFYHAVVVMKENGISYKVYPG